MDEFDRNYQLYSDAFNRARTDQERQDLLYGLGISNPRRNNDWISYLPLLTDHNPNGALEQMTDFELLDQLPRNLRMQADNFITRRDLVNFVRDNRRTAETQTPMVTIPRVGRSKVRAPPVSHKIASPTRVATPHRPITRAVTPPRTVISPSTTRRQRANVPLPTSLTTRLPDTVIRSPITERRVSPPTLTRRPTAATATGTRRVGLLSTSPTRRIKPVALKKPPTSASYEKCVEDAAARKAKGKLKLCPAGYCTAKEKFDIYPSAYANGYAVQVCKGTKPDHYGAVYDHYGEAGEVRPAEGGDLGRWFEEKWVNVCEPGMPECGRKEARFDPNDYPYCRPTVKLPGSTVKTVGELSKSEIAEMCKRKRAFQLAPEKVFVRDLPARR